MIQYFRFRKRTDNTKVLYFREKKSIFDKKIKEKYISKKKSLLILGIEASGKSKLLARLVENIDLLFPRNLKIIFKATDNLTEILYKNLDGDEETQKLLITKNTEEEEKEIEILDIKKQHVKIEALKQKAKNNIIIIDDIDRLTGKKLEITKDLIRDCKIFIVTAKSENKINRTLRNIMQQKKTERIQLKSASSVDATNVLFAMFVIWLLIVGLHEAAMLVIAGRLLAKGTK